MSFKTEDLREKPINELTSQQLKSRLHLVRDQMVQNHNERLELNRMEQAIDEELAKR